MTNPPAVLKRFFAAYAKRTNDALKASPRVDTKGIVRSFAPYFVEASPAGVYGGKNGLKFRLLIPRGFAHYRKIGATSMNVASLRLTRLDDLHYLARVGWDTRYVTKRGLHKRIRFTNLYLVHFHKGKPQIFAYITGDERKVLRQHGLE